MAKSFWMNDDKQTGNYSNDRQDTFTPESSYIGIRLQQGVPLLDRDWNELEDLRRYQELSLRKHYIGNGCPDQDSFAITPRTPRANDFIINHGRYLVDGLEAVHPAPDPPAPLYFSDQIPVDENDSFLLTPPASDRVDSVYLDLWIREVRAGEVDALGNLQDVDMETTVRHKLEWRVRVLEDITGVNREVYENGDLTPNHHYAELARIIRTGGTPEITAASLKDSRRTNLSLDKLRDVTDTGEDHIVSRAITEADGSTGQDTNSGTGIKTGHIQDEAVTEIKLDPAVREKLVEGGLAHNHDGAGGGAQVSHGDLNFNDGANPHGVSLEQLAELDAAGRQISGLPGPVDSADAATRGYTDTALNDLHTTLTADIQGIRDSLMGMLGSSTFSYVVQDQASFNGLFEKDPAGDPDIFRIKTEYKSVFVKAGSYDVRTAMTSLETAADAFLVLTNACTLLFCESGAAWDYGGTAGGLHVNTEGCRIYFLTITGNDGLLSGPEMLIPSFQIDAPSISLTGCIARNRHCIGFQGSNTNEGDNAINRSSCLESCEARELFTGDWDIPAQGVGEAITGFHFCGNLSRCRVKDLARGSVLRWVSTSEYPTLEVTGFSRCYHLNQCLADHVGSGFTFVATYAESDPYVYRNLRITGFGTCRYLAACTSDATGHSVVLSHGLIGTNHYSEVVIAGYNSCYQAVNSRAQGTGNSFSCSHDPSNGVAELMYNASVAGFRSVLQAVNCRAYANGDNLPDEDSGVGFLECDMLSSCVAHENGRNSGLGIGFQESRMISGSNAYRNGEANGVGFDYCQCVAACVSDHHRGEDWQDCTYTAANYIIS